MLIGAVACTYSGLYDVAATTPHSRPIEWFIHTTYHASVARRAESVSVPDLDDEQSKLAGAGDYDAMCAGCHGAPGQKPAAVGQGLNPAPPDLAETASHLTDAELFWVTEHGIRMTGMLAWGATHSDDALWSVIAFVRELPNLGAAEYRDWVARSKGLSHHSPSNSQSPEEPGQQDQGRSSGHEHDHSH